MLTTIWCEMLNEKIKSPDPIVEANRELLLQRSVVGLQKYGVTVNDNPLSRRQWLQHALEEALDLANYLQKLIQEEDKQGK